jgi:hypothetical protein
VGGAAISPGDHQLSKGLITRVKSWPNVAEPINYAIPSGVLRRLNWDVTGSLTNTVSML